MSKPLCIYCQEREADSRDHVPPDGIFGKPLPPVLITVPACSTCHKGFNLDDTHFLMLAHELEAAKTADGAAVSAKQIEKVQEHLREGRPSGPAFLNRLQPVTLVTPENPDGVPTFAYPMDRSRLIKTASRIIRGLYYEVSDKNHRLKRALPRDCQIRVHMWNQPDEYLGFPNKEAFEQYLSHLNHRSLRDNGFEFWYRLSDVNPDASIWHLNVLGRYHFDATTGTEEEITEASDAWDLADASAQLEPMVIRRPPPPEGAQS